MRWVLVALAVAGLASCAVSGGLVPGQSSETDVEKKMGPSADRRQLSNGETVRYYPHLPHGRETFAAIFGRDGKLLRIEQRLTDENVAKLQVNRSTADDVRELLGPPYRTQVYPLGQREVWLYPMRGIPYLRMLNLEFTTDKVLREVKFFDDTQNDPN